MPLASFAPIATFDLTTRCPLRCRHCYYFSDGPEPIQNKRDLAEEEYAEKINDLQATWGIESAFWIGGEPLLRVGLITQLLQLFRNNAIATSAMVPIPSDLAAGLIVSIDGPQSLHDQLRGSGSFARAHKHLRQLRPGQFVISTTLTALTLSAIDALPQVVDQIGAVGCLVGFYVGQDPLLLLSSDQKNEAIDRLHNVRAKHPELILNTAVGLEQLRPQRTNATAVPCIYTHRALAFDHRLQIKTPCSFGNLADCTACGCPIVAEQRARHLGAHEATKLLRFLFKPHPTLQPTVQTSP